MLYFNCISNGTTSNRGTGKDLSQNTTNLVIINAMTETRIGWKWRNRIENTVEGKLVTLAMKLVCQYSYWSSQEVSEPKLLEVKERGAQSGRCDESWKLFPVEQHNSGMILRQCLEGVLMKTTIVQRKCLITQCWKWQCGRRQGRNIGKSCPCWRTREWILLENFVKTMSCMGV